MSDCPYPTRRNHKDKAVQCKDIPDRVALDAVVAAQISLHDDFANAKNAADRLAEQNPEWGIVAWPKLERLDQRGLLGYGTSIRWAWPTAKAYELFPGLGKLHWMRP